MLQIALVPPPAEVEIDGPSVFLPILQIVLIVIGWIAIALYASRSAQLARAGQDVSRMVATAARSEDRAALGVTSVWSLSGPWM